MQKTPWKWHDTGALAYMSIHLSEEPQLIGKNVPWTVIREGQGNRQQIARLCSRSFFVFFIVFLRIPKISTRTSIHEHLQRKLPTTSKRDVQVTPDGPPTPIILMVQHLR